MHIGRRLPASAVATAGALLALACACTVTVEGDDDPSYGEVTFSVARFDQHGIELSRDVRTAPGAELVGPLDGELDDPIEVDGAEVRDPAGLLAAREARVGEVLLTRSRPDLLVASGSSLLAVQSAERNGWALVVAVDDGRFEIALAGELAAASADRILATGLVRMIRGEPLLDDDCLPVCQ